MGVYYSRRTSGNKSTVGTSLNLIFIQALLIFSPSQAMDVVSYEYIIFIQMQNWDRRKDAPRQKMVTQYFHHFCLIWSLFSQVVSTSVKYVNLQVGVITVLVGNYLLFLGPINAKS